MDFSLRATLPQIMNADLNTTYNFRTSYFFMNMEHVFYSNTSQGNNTESERVFLPKGYHKKRYDYLRNTVPHDSHPEAHRFLDYEDLPYWNFIKWF